MYILIDLFFPYTIPATLDGSERFIIHWHSFLSIFAGKLIDDVRQVLVPPHNTQTLYIPRKRKEKQEVRSTTKLILSISSC